MNDEDEVRVSCPCCGRMMAEAQVRAEIERMTEEHRKLVNATRSMTDEAEYSEAIDAIGLCDIEVRLPGETIGLGMSEYKEGSQ